MAEARAILDAALALRLAAATVGASNPKGAHELTKKAENLYHTGVTDGLGSDKSGAEEAVKIWEAGYGGSMDDPKFRDQVYEVAAKYRKMLQDKDQDAAHRREAQAKLSNDRRAQAQQKLIRNRRRGKP